MSEGKDRYEARREAELLEMQNRLARAKSEAASNAFFDLALVALTAFFDGKADLDVRSDSMGNYSVRFRLSPESTDV